MKKINGYINSYDEALLVVHAARLGALEVTKERLNIDARERIESGNIFCFIENSSGMKRWTDGRIWSPSKICGEFLIYQEVPRHLSKNSLKKQKEIDKVYEKEAGSMRRGARDETIDRTTMHKKTVCIKHENKTYHIVAYYRPVFATVFLLDIKYFKKLEAALTVYPELRSDETLEREMADGDAFFERYNLDRDVVRPALDPSKRDVLEKIAVDVLTSLSKSSPKRYRHIIF
ncbi:Gti1/Pac2 family transcription factor [Pancytospora philotis]|nr:Gti1/Pac2 family transcription factor [Pancytospora philotis]